LLELHESRAATRFDAADRLVLLEDQDRSLWNRALIASAVTRLARAAAQDRPGPYQLQAAIAVQHALAPSYELTDWTAVRALYDRLQILRPSPVVLLSRAVATGFVDGPAAALAEVDALADRLQGYRLWHAARADLLRRLGRNDEARVAYERALELTHAEPERRFLEGRLAAL
jgi:RNA polymerase sigma-70 factor (ECF subfamily)